MTTDPLHVDHVLARAASGPDEELLRDARGPVTAGAFAALVAQLARALEQRGLGRGDRIAILAANSVAAVAVRYAAAVVGSASVFCPNRGPQAVAGFLAAVDPTLLVVSPERAGVAAGAGYAVASLGPAAGVGADLLAEAAGQSSEPVATTARAEDVGVLVTSGGTTGAQKASRLTFGAYARLVTTPPMPDRRQLVCLPLAYVSQIHLDQALVGGGTAVLVDGFDPGAVLATIEAERITHLGLVEPKLVELVDHPDVERRDLSSLRAVSHIGANAPAGLRRRLLERIGPVLVHPYGASEIGVVSVLAPPDYDLARPELLTSSGRVLPGIDVRIETPTGEPVPAGEVGLIVVRTPAAAVSYAGGAGPVTDAAGDRHTGDLGRLDADGFLHVRGRAADAREIDGRTVLPLDVEEALCARPDVRYAVAFPTADGRFAAAIVPAAGAALDLEALRDEALGAIVLLDRIPATEQGKPDRAALTELLAGA